MDNTLVDVLFSRAKTNPDRHVFHYLNFDLTIFKSISYFELREVAISLSKYINNYIKKGERILLLFENSPNFIFSFFGVILSHCIPVCADPSKRNLAKHLAYYLYDLEINHVLTSENTIKQIVDFLPKNYKLLFHTVEKALLSNILNDSLTIPQRDDICFIQYTSGSTSKPKGVVVSHFNLLSNLEQIKNAFGATKNSIGLSWLPHFHDMGLVGGLIQPFYSVFPVYIISYKCFAQRPIDWLRAIDRYRVSITGGPNIAYEYLCKQYNVNDTFDLSCWKVAFIGADFVSATTILQFAKNMAKFKFKSNSLVPCYGMAEATLMVCSHTPGANLIIYPNESILKLSATDANYYIRDDAVSCGKVNLFTDIIIVKNNKICKENQPGEICISGNNIVNRYWNKSLNIFIPIAADNCLASCYMKTGDIGILSGGELFVIGRSKDLLIVNGINISPVDIERDIQKISKYLLVGRGIVYQETNIYLGLVQEVERKDNQIDWRNLSHQIRLQIFKKYGLIIRTIKFVKRGVLAVTSSGKMIRTQLSNIKETAFVYREKFQPKTKELNYE